MCKIYAYVISGSFHIEIGCFWLSVAKNSALHLQPGTEMQLNTVETVEYYQFHLVHQTSSIERLRSPQEPVTMISHSQACVILMIN